MPRQRMPVIGTHKQTGETVYFPSPCYAPGFHQSGIKAAINGRAKSHPVKPGFFGDDNGRWLRNNAATWKVALANTIATPLHKPEPEYRGAPRRRTSNG